MALPLPDAAAWRFPAEVLVIEDGPRAVLVPEPGGGRVTVQWSFDAGANDDDAGSFGLTHLVEHLAFGPIGRSDAPDFDARLGVLGGSSDGWTDRERTGWGATIPITSPDDLSALLAVEAERWRSLVIEEPSLNRQRVIIGEELAETQDVPHGRDRTWLDMRLWGSGQPWSRHPQSAPTEAADRGAAQAKWTWLRQRAIVVIAGDFLPHSLDIPLQAAFGHTTTRAPPRPALSLGDPGCEPGPPSVSWVKDNVAEGAVYLAWPIPGRDHPDRVALEAMARWMGGARVSTGTGCGELVVERRGTWLSMVQHVSSMRRAAGALAAAGLDPASLDRVRIAQLTDLARAVGMLEVRARAAGGCVLAGRTPDCLADEAAAWIGLTTEATRKAAAKWLEPEAMTILAVLPPDTLFAPPVAGMPARSAW